MSVFAETTNKPLTANQLLTQLQGKNKPIVAKQLINNSNKWDKVLTQISGGDQKWLIVAKTLKPYTDASTAESLNFAVAKAMPENPVGVLKLVGHHFYLEEVCTVPFIEEKPAIVNQYLKQTIMALKGQHPSSMNKLVNQCLAILKPARIVS